MTRHKHFLGNKPGFVSIAYEMYQQPDSLVVMYRGQVVATTNGPRAGRGGVGFNWQPVGNDYSVDVIVTGAGQGTLWNYKIACPK